MRRVALLLCVSALALASACSDRSTSPTADATSRRSLEIVPVCLTATEITSLIDAAFVDGSPDEQAALGKWENIQRQRAAGDREAIIREKTIDLVDFLLTKKQQGKLLAEANETTLAAFADLINALFCYANLGQYYFPGGDGWFIYPSDDTQTIEREDGQAAMRLPANAVFSPTLVTITPTNTALNTKLDKYPQNFEFSKYPSNEPFAKFVITEVCAATPSPEIFEELVLGHNKSNGTFELLAEVPSLLTRCATTQASAPASITDRLLGLVLPRTLHAAVMFGGGGVAGSVLELSPIGPVDPRVFVTPSFNTTTSAPIGSLVTPAPSVTLKTLNDTPIDGVRVDFATLVGPTYATGATRSPASASTNAAGTAQTAWRLGTNTTLPYGLTATPQLTGSAAVVGTEFVPSTVTFTAQALPAAGLEITATPPTDTAGATLDSLNARIVDVQNRTVEGYAGSVVVTGPAGVAISGTTTRAVTDGLVSFTDLVITKAGTHLLTLAATPTGTGNFVKTASVTVAKGAARLTIASGNNQSATAPATLGTASPFIRVLVQDAFGNKYANTRVYWSTFDGSQPGSSPTSTDANGIAGNTWSIEEGLNTLYASLDENALLVGRHDVFTATGLPPRRSEAIVSCAVGNSRPSMLDHYVRVSSPSRVNEIKMFFSVQGDANPNVPKIYELEMTVSQQIRSGNTWGTPSELAKKRALVPLRGNAAQNDGGGNFDFGTGFTPAANSRLLISVRNVGVIDGTLRFNAGTGSDCSASTFRATDNTLFRNSAAIQIYGVR